VHALPRGRPRRTRGVDRRGRGPGRARHPRGPLPVDAGDVRRRADGRPRRPARRPRPSRRCRRPRSRGRVARLAAGRRSAREPGLGSPPRLYNQIARVIAAERGNTEVQNARYFALINLAMADAGISAWETKYVYNFWRPVTAVRAAAADGNPDTAADPAWSPL